MNLFAKIFIGFWLSTAAIIGSWLLASQYIDPFDGELAEPPLATPEPRGRPMGPRRPPGSPEMGSAPRNMFRIYYGLQNIAAADLPAWIEKQEQRDDIQILLVNEKGKEIFGRALPAGTKPILDRLAGFRRRAAHREGSTVLFGQELYRPEWGTLRLVIATKAPASPIVKFLTEHLWLRLLLALLISGIISYTVSRYLTRPLKNLQQASRDLAKGNLEARIEVPKRGGDETDELARDFNTMAAQLQEKIQAQKRLLSDVSHELRSPLARMRVALALAEKDPARSAAQLRRLELETERLDVLIGQLLSAPDNHSTMEDSIDLVSLLQQVCDDANFEAQTTHKRVNYSTDLEEVVIPSHGDLMEKAFQNVIRNAVHYTKDNGVVTVRLDKTDAGLSVTVDDQGPGVPAAELEKIFEPFYRIDEARQRDTGGFGLGLSIARRAIERHGGQLNAENLNEGLRVSMEIPYQAELPG